MPIKVLCEKCGFPLYTDLDVKAPHEIILEYNGRCPNCAKRLHHKPRNIEIKPLLNIVKQA